MHDAAPSSPAEEAPSAGAGYAMPLFWLYLAFYAGFMILSAFRIDLMGQPVFAGLNLAIVYGLGLIGGAVLMALLYAVLSHGPARGGRQ